MSKYIFDEDKKQLYCALIIIDAIVDKGSHFVTNLLSEDEQKLLPIFQNIIIISASVNIPTIISRNKTATACWAAISASMALKPGIPMPAGMALHCRPNKAIAA